MTLAEARQILGLGPEDDPRPHLVEFGKARYRMAEMVRCAPNSVLAERYRKGLNEFDGALAVIRTSLEEPVPAVFQKAPEPESPAASPEPPPIAPVVFQKAPEREEPAEVSPEPPALPPHPATVTARRETAPSEQLSPETDDPNDEDDEDARAGRRGLILACLFLALFIAAAGGGLLYLKMEEDKEIRRQARIVELERQGAALVENRRWPEAAEAFDEIETLDPGSHIASLGRSSIEAGIAEEQTQFIAYWTGQAVASLEAGLWQDAEAAARQVLERFPDEKEAADILTRTAEARRAAERAAAIAAVSKHLEARRWDDAIAAARELNAREPNDIEVVILLSDAVAARDKAVADMARARELLARAIERDEGKFDQIALELLREATALAPDDEEIAARLEKMSAYTRTLRVPGDFATPAEALAEARDRDRVVLGPGTWQGPLVGDAAVDLQGAGPAETIIECPAEDGSALTLGPGARGGHVTGITFRHSTFAAGDDRFSAVLARGAHVTFADCRFVEASGHGLAVIEGGHVVASRCRFAGNGWNGVAAIGEGSLLEVRDSESNGNFENGIESWDGAAVILVNNRCEDNSRNGIHADNGTGSVTVEGNQLVSNREFGLVVGSAGSGAVTGNSLRNNHLGGLVVRHAAASVQLTDNTGTGNRGPGLVLEKGLTTAAYSRNNFTGNLGQQIVSDTDLSAEEELPEAPPADSPDAAKDDRETPPPAAIIVPEEELRAE